MFAIETNKNILKYIYYRKNKRFTFQHKYNDRIINNIKNFLDQINSNKEYLYMINFETNYLEISCYNYKMHFSLLEYGNGVNDSTFGGIDLEDYKRSIENIFYVDKSADKIAYKNISNKCKTQENILTRIKNYFW